LLAVSVTPFKAVSQLAYQVGLTLCTVADDRDRYTVVDQVGLALYNVADDNATVTPDVC
jgi:hypothetical protein